MLNLDELLGEKKSIQWGGQEYQVNEPSLGNILEAERILKASDEKEHLSGMSDFVKLMVPGLDVSNIPVRLIPALFEYITTSGAEKKTEAPAETEVTEETETSK